MAKIQTKTEDSNLNVYIDLNVELHGALNEYTTFTTEYLNSTLEISVPNKIKEGHMIRVIGRGKQDGEQSGDLYLVMKTVNRDDVKVDSDND